MKTNQMQFTEKKEKELRNQYINRVEVLDRVKKLLLIPELNMMNTKQIADFYEVDMETMVKCCQRNAKEIAEDGVLHCSVQEFIERSRQGVHFVKTKANTEVFYDNGLVVKVSNRGIKLFSKRAVLRIGMLLRDSEIAKEVRTQLLNVFENTANETKVSELNEELAIQQRLGQAMFSGDTNKITEAMAEAMAYKNRHIEALSKNNVQLKQKNDDLTLVNKGLTKKTLKWDNPKMLNKAIRLMAAARQMSYAKQWNEFYNEMLYKHGIGLRQRCCTSPIKAIKSNEWDIVWQTITAICEGCYLNTADILKRAKISD